MSPNKMCSQKKALLLFVLVSSSLGLSPSGAFAGDEFEEVDPVVVQSAPAANTAPSLLGKLHPLAVHLPIGWLLLLLLVEGLATRSERWEAVALPLALLTLAAFFPALLTGFLRTGGSETLTEGVLAHRNVMLASTAALVVGAALRLLARRRFTWPLRVAYLLLIVGSSLLMVFGGHLGGELVHGESYLPF